jgi:hypothetical protein
MTAFHFRPTHYEEAFRADSFLEYSFFELQKSFILPREMLTMFSDEANDLFILATTFLSFI